MLTLEDLSVPKSFLISICCSMAAYFIMRALKRKKGEDKILLAFWISCALFYMALGAATLVFYFIPTMGYKIYYLCLLFAGLQVFIGIFYLIQKVITKPIIKKIIAVILAIGLIIYLAWSFMNAKPSVRYGEPILLIEQGSPQGYTGAVIILVIIGFSMFLFRRDLKKGIIDWGHMTEFYKFYAFILYMAISLIRILYFLPHPWYLEIFYLFIPYLAYKSYKEE